MACLPRPLAEQRISLPCKARCPPTGFNRRLGKCQRHGNEIGTVQNIGPDLLNGFAVSVHAVKLCPALQRVQILRIRRPHDGAAPLPDLFIGRKDQRQDDGDKAVFLLLDRKADMRIRDFAGQGPRDNHRNRRCLADLGADGWGQGWRLCRTQLCLWLGWCRRLPPRLDRRHFWCSALLKGREPGVGGAGVRAAKRLASRRLWRWCLDKFHRLRRYHIFDHRQINHRRIDHNSDSRRGGPTRRIQQGNIAAHLGRWRQDFDRLHSFATAKPLRRLQLK